MKTVEIYAALDRCRETKLEIDKLTERIEAARNFCPCSPVLSDMPKSHGAKRDLADVLALSDDLIRQRARLEDRFVDAYAAASSCIQSVKSKKAQLCLHSYYIDGRSRREIADRLGVGYGAIYMILARSIKSISEDNY